MELSLQIVNNETGKPLDLILGPETTIGRKGYNKLQINEPYVSAQHAVITRTAPGFFVLEDCGSRNGTFVNEKAVIRPAPIKAGDVIRFGIASCSVVPVELPAMESMDRGNTKRGSSQSVAAVNGGTWRLNSGLRSARGTGVPRARSYRAGRQCKKTRSKKHYFGLKNRPGRSLKAGRLDYFSHQI